MSHGAGGPPLDPREERFRPLVSFLRAGIALVATLGVLALLVGGELGEDLAAALVVLLVVLPLVRVTWFVARWYRRGDLRFALVGVIVLLVPVAALLLSR